MKLVIKNMEWLFFIVLIFLMTLVTILLPLLTPPGSRGRPPVETALYLYYPLLYTHISVGAIASLAGIFQFSSKLRAKHPRVHRITGRVYMLCILVGGLTAFSIAYYTTSFDRQVTFLTLNVLWLLSAWKAYRAIRLGKVVEHRLWIVRNYALTLAAVFARLIVPLLAILLIVQGRFPLMASIHLRSNT